MINSIIFDWKRTLYDPEKRELIQGSRIVVRGLYDHGLDLYLVGKDSEGDMPRELNRTGLWPFFADTRFVTGVKSDGDFARFMDLANPDRTVVVGDRVRSEIEIGNRLGAVTVQYAQGKFKSEVPEAFVQEPDYRIFHLLDLMPIVRQLRSETD